MAFFKYTVKNEHGETLKGRVESQSLEMAAATLQSRQLFVISLHPSDDGMFASVKAMLFGIKLGDVVNFTRQLSTMITAGVTLIEALGILRQQSTGEMRRLIEDLLRELEGGSSFAKALSTQGKTFSPVYIQLVKAGETAGVLDQVLQRLADNLEKQKEFNSKTKGAMVYPVIVMIVMVIVMAVMMIFVMPKLSQMYTDLGAQLPFVTQLIINMSTFLANFWWAFLVAIAGGVLFFRAWYKTPSGHLRWDRWMLEIPVLGVLRQKIILTEFCRTMSLLVSSGISILEATEILTGAMENEVYLQALQETRKNLEKGVSLSQSISKYELFPPILAQMLTVGEETGKMDEVLLKLSLYFESESEHAVKNLTTAFEPIVMIVLGLGVGVLVIAIILPIYQITANF